MTASLPNLSDHYFERILLINFGGIGDEILFFPVIDALRYHYPNTRIAMLVEPRCRNLMEHHYFIDEVLTFDIKHRKSPGDLLELLNLLRNEAPEMIISSGSSTLVAGLLFLSGAPIRVGYDSGRLRFLLTHKAPLNGNQYAARMYHDLLQPLGFPDRPVLPRMHLPAIVESWARDWLQQQGIGKDEPYVLMHPGVSLMSKEKQLIKSWERERWQALIEQLLAEGERVVLAGGPDDADEISWLTARIQHPRLTLAYGQTRDLYQLGALIRRSSAIVCVDSAPMHLGVALEANVVAIFGPTDPEKLVPMDSPRIRVLTHDVACRPCLWATRQTTCATLDCLKGISVGSVYDAVRGFLPARLESPPA
ncbi:MAG: glycosyltransferase family 9 protein [Candidatus Sericytochromatia bacterium]